MPVRSLSSPVLRWPDAEVVDAAVRAWAKQVAREVEGVMRIGYFGSYARGDWGVGSDLDIIALVTTSKEPFITRARGWDATRLPVPADVLVYTWDEWRRLGGGRFQETVSREVVWVYGDDEEGSHGTRSA